MSSWDETGFHIADPKHPDNASAGAGAPGLWRAKRADPVVYDAAREARFPNPPAGVGEARPAEPPTETEQ